jgi:poly(A) polymerase
MDVRINKSTINTLIKLKELLPEKTYLVGGTLRDILLNRPVTDIDLVTENLTECKVRNWGVFLGISFVELDGQRGIYRLAGNIKGQFVQLDLENLGDGIISNLKRRDFTLNSLAVPFHIWLTRKNWIENIIDPLGGLADINRGTIRAVSDANIREDPIRVLRGFRLLGKLGFSLDKDTLTSIRNSSALLDSCPGERIWPELSQILSLPHSASVIRLMDDNTPIWEILISEVKTLKKMEQGGHHVDVVWEHQLKTLEWAEEQLSKEFSGNQEIQSYLGEMITKISKKLSVFKLALLLHDIGKAYCRKKDPEKNSYTFYGHDYLGGEAISRICERLRMSAGETKLMENLINHHMSPLFLYRSDDITPRVLRRFLQKTQEEFIGILFLSLADVVSTRLAAGKFQEAEAYQEFIFRILEQLVSEMNNYLYPKLFLNGHDICRILQVSPSPKVGEILEALEDAQVEGIVNSREKAEEFVRKNYLFIQ